MDDFAKLRRWLARVLATKQGKWSVFQWLEIVLPIIVIAMLWNILSKPLLNSGHTRASVLPTPTVLPTPGIGSKVYLHSAGNSGMFPLAVDEQAYDELSSAMMAKDSYGCQELVNSGKVFLVEEGTEVLIIDRTLYLVKVRILEGTNQGKAGWVIHEAVD